MTFQQLALPLAGGLLIGLASATLLLVQGRIAGISGIVGGLVDGRAEGWRWAFVLGLLAGGGLLLLALPGAFAAPTGRPLAVVALAGLLVGYGTRRGNGCTSGHGVCGLGRFSLRSLAATLTFMATGALTATLFGWLGGAR